jgi:hypothetical protein
MIWATSYASIDGVVKKPKWHKEQGSIVIKLEVVKETENNSYDELSKLCGESIF